MVKEMKNAAEFSQRLNRADRAEMADLISRCAGADAKEKGILFSCADELRRSVYGKKVYFRGLIEFSSHCKNDCFYCGIRSGNNNAVRYRLSGREILSCCENGYALGFRTFVLQSGEDPRCTDEWICALVREIKERFPDCAVTLSVGEKSFDSYKKYYDAGADRYLLRHETASDGHYKKLHPAYLSLENRKRCLYDLKQIGFQVGAGFMVGSPYQTFETLAEDMLFLRALSPHMVGIGPFVPHKDSVFADFCEPSPDMTLVMLALVRILLPGVLLPATTALGTVDPRGREKGLMAGANVVMPNLSPALHRKDYALYDNKICTGEEAAECLGCLTRRIESAGFEPDFSRGDHIDARQNGYQD